MTTFAVTGIIWVNSRNSDITDDSNDEENKPFFCCNVVSK